ncbi:hypothetical protein GWI33_020443 [Rhynchophorus ferrugineus]|uniref:Uncharacterized protein n=1 Tax=Rhynchophorus ferrugineus TaxID=354439 RepID=A0A834HPG7_RHYFE|nr:hypothetical protein GWI33_020443 [Rhynchophorus ferrugineus]
MSTKDGERSGRSKELRYGHIVVRSRCDNVIKTLITSYANSLTNCLTASNCHGSNFLHDGVFATDSNVRS